MSAVIALLILNFVDEHSDARYMRAMASIFFQLARSFG
jgi:hypothetical protein